MFHFCLAFSIAWLIYLRYLPYLAAEVEKNQETAQQK